MYYVLSRSKDITTTKEVEPVKVFDNLLYATNALHILIIKSFCRKLNKLDYKPDSENIEEFNPIEIYKKMFEFKEFEEIIYIKINDYDYFIDIYEDIPDSSDSETEKLDSDTETI